MSKPAARVGDMHICPMLTPGVPPIPHVGGPIIGPGVPTVLVGGMPASVMGDMCTCVGPPDSIIIGSTGVLIGGKPAARMGDMTAHGGSIMMGLPTVLIGEISPSAVMTKTSLTILDKMPANAATVAKQTLTMQQAAKKGKPFCEECTTEEKPRIYNLQWVKNRSIVSESKVLKQVTLKASVENMGDGTSITFTVKTPEELLDNGTDQKAAKVIELTGTVKNNTVEVIWEIEDPTEESGNSTNQNT